MLKRFGISIILTAAVIFASVGGTVTAVSTSAKSAVLVDATTGKILYEQNAYEQLSMASTTKIMTALIALESDMIDETVLITKEMITVEGTSMGLAEGDEITVDALCCGMLLLSGNDAANAIAIALGGSFEGFAELMNEKAQQLGMNGSHFVTPSGLDAEGHHTTAYDMAVLASAAMKNERFYEIVSSASMKITYGTPPTEHYLTNHNKLLKSYDGAVGVKTGFTKKSGRCLVSAAERDGVLLVAVTLNDGDDWRDHAALLDYGFSTVSDIDFYAALSDIDLPVVGGASDAIGVRTEPVQKKMCSTSPGDITYKVYLDRFVYAPVNKGEVMGRIDYYVNGSFICSAEISAADTVHYKYPDSK